MPCYRQVSSSLRFGVESARMHYREALRGPLIQVLKFASFVAVVLVVLKTGPAASSALAPSPQELCDRAKYGMSLDQVERTTALSEGWQTLRGDGRLIVSGHGYYSSSSVCSVTFDPSGHVSSKLVREQESGDIPTL
jgi:hypothetical protein